MNITNDFEDCAILSGDHTLGETMFRVADIVLLLAHARALEAMLKKVQWVTWVGDIRYCPECEEHDFVGHTPDCQLAKLLDGVE